MKTNTKHEVSIWSCRNVLFLFICISSLAYQYVVWFVYQNSPNTTWKLPQYRDSQELHRRVLSVDNLRNFVRVTLEKHLHQQSVEEIRKKLQKSGLTRNNLMQTSRKVIKNFNTCAIVGSSGLLSNSNCGTEISAHDFILRANWAQIDGFQDDVGHRTDLMSLNTPSCLQLNKCLRKNSKTKCYHTYHVHELKNTTVILPRAAELTIASKQKEVNKCIKVLRGESLDIRLPIETTRVIKRTMGISKLPSAGIRLLAFAFTFCRQISLYGFYPFSTSPSGNPIKYHYFDEGFTKNIVHNMSEEFKILIQLNENHVIRLVTNNCTRSN